MRSIIVLCSLLLLAVASGFTAPVSITNTVDVQAVAAPSSIVSAPHQQLLNDGINAWSASSSSVVLSDIDEEASKIAAMAAKNKAANEAARAKEEARKKSKEQLAEEKKTFAWYFWGGGFVAPFLATFYYFGFKFWEK
jgi:hypothetical protein